MTDPSSPAAGRLGVIDLDTVELADLQAQEQRLERALGVVRGLMAALRGDARESRDPGSGIRIPEPPPAPPAPSGNGGATVPALRRLVSGNGVLERLRSEAIPVPTATPAVRSEAIDAGPAGPRRAPAERGRNRAAVAVRNEQAILDALDANGETLQASLADRANVPLGSIVPVCRRLERAGKLVRREIPAGSSCRVLWRLPGQQPKADIYNGSSSVGGKAMQDRGKRIRERKEQAEAAQVGEGNTLRARVLETLRQAGDEGLTMAHLAAAVPGSERAGAVEDKVRELWQSGALGRRRDGTFVIASTRQWHVGEDRDTEAAA